MPKQTRTRTRNAAESARRTERHRRRLEASYEPRDADRRPPLGGAAEPPLGPYEFRYRIEHGYGSARPIA